MSTELTHYAKRLRKDATKAESRLWRRLRARQMQGIKFRRQQPIGKYIVDFASFEKRIVIEIDGGQHAAGRKKDEQRDKFFAENGYNVIRFWDNEVFENIEGILEIIMKNCHK